MPWDSLLKRRHNALVYRFVVDTVAGNKAVAKKLNISKGTLYADLDGAINDMLVFCAGLPYIMQGKQPEVEEAVKLTIKQYPLLDRIGQTEQWLCLFPVRLRSGIQSAREATRRFLCLFDKGMAVYADFCGQYNQFGVNGRRLDALKQDIKGNNKVAREVAEKYGCSPETIYSDMKENQERICHLLSVFLNGEETERSLM